MDKVLTVTCDDKRGYEENEKIYDVVEFVTQKKGWSYLEETDNKGK